MRRARRTSSSRARVSCDRRNGSHAPTADRAIAAGLAGDRRILRSHEPGALYRSRISTAVSGTLAVRAAVLQLFLIETPQGLKLGMFLVDRGGTPRRIKGKIRRLITQLASLPAFDSLIEAGRFRVTVLTGLPAQQQNIRRQLRRQSFRNVEIEVVLVPEVGELLTMR